MAIFRRDPPPLAGASNAGGIKNRNFRPISRFISKMIQDRSQLLWNANRKRSLGAPPSKPLLYVTNASKLQEVAGKHGVGFRWFVDDSQLYRSVLVEDNAVAKQTMINCVLDMRRWSSSHWLQRNVSKSEVVWLGSRQ